jgi:hypothetical protein
LFSREGVTAVEEPLGCPNVSSVACKYASIFQEFLQQSGLPIWNRFKNTGFWRQLTVRVAEHVEAMEEVQLIALLLLPSCCSPATPLNFVILC